MIEHSVKRGDLVLLQVPSGTDEADMLRHAGGLFAEAGVKVAVISDRVKIHIFSGDEWHPKSESPQRPGWYATGSKHTGYPYTVPRYYGDDDGSWWIYSDHHDSRTLVPNDSFDYWCEIPQWDGGEG